MASTARSPPGASQRQGEGARKNFPRFKPRNPLKSLDSHERIQGNPRQSNPHGAGLQSETVRAKKAQTDRPDQRRDPPPRRSQTDSIQRQSALAADSPSVQPQFVEGELRTAGCRFAFSHGCGKPRHADQAALRSVAVAAAARRSTLPRGPRGTASTAHSRSGAL